MRRSSPIVRSSPTWELLRKQSNISIDELVLTGSGTRRRVDLKVTVDDVEGRALG